VQLAFKFFVLLDFSGCFHKVLLNSIITIGSDSENASLSTHHSHISSVEIFAKLRDCFEVKLSLLADALRMNLQNVQAGRLIGKRNLNLSIHSARSKKSWVELIGSVSSHNTLYLTKIIKTIKLVQ